MEGGSKGRREEGKERGRKTVEKIHILTNTCLVSEFLLLS